MEVWKIIPTFAIPKDIGVMKKKVYRHQLIDTFCDGGYSYEDYVESCEMNDIEPEEEGSNAYWEWIGEQLDEDWSCLLDNTKYGSNNGKCMVYGKVGRWNGTFSVEPKIFGTLVEAFKFLMQGYDAVQAWETNNEIEFHGLHHDGTDIFYIRPMNNRKHNLEDWEICEHDNPLWFTGKYPEWIF